MFKDYLVAEDVAEILNIAIPASYKVIRKLNNELKAAGYKTFSGKVSKKYFFERYGITNAA